jgi:hypothetical protein
MALDPLTAALDIGGKLIDKFFPDPAQADAAKLKLLEMQQSGELAKLTAETDLAKGQLTINEKEAQSESIFVAGGRPFIIWMCGCALGYATILEPVARFVATVVYHYNGAFPAIDTALTLQILLGLLGLSGMRSYDKKNGTASK